MQKMLGLIAVSLIGGCATTTSTQFERDPITKQILLDGKGDPIVARSDEHNYADPAGLGLRIAADAKATDVTSEANAQAVKVLAETCYRSLMAQEPIEEGGVNFECGKGVITHGQRGYGYYPYDGGDPYLYPESYRNVHMNGRSRHQYRRLGPTGRRMNPMPRTGFGDTQLASIESATVVEEDSGRGSKGKGPGKIKLTEEEKVELTEEEKVEQEILIDKLARCKVPTIANTEVGGGTGCKAAVDELDKFEKRMIEKRRLAEQMRLAFSGTTATAAATGTTSGRPDGGSQSVPPSAPIAAPPVAVPGVDAGAPSLRTPAVIK
ncbi:MAG: hypothetical protein WCJ29_04110 [bacterium]